MLTYLEQILAITAPVFLLILLGVVLKKRKTIDEVFIAQGSKLVFDVALPVLMFGAIARTDLSTLMSSSMLIACSVAAVVTFYATWWPLKWGYQKFTSKSQVQQQLGVVAQGGYRSNLGIIGLALCANAGGSAGLAAGAVVLALVTPVYNIFSVYVLNYAHSYGRNDDGRSMSMGAVLWGIVKNPLILAIFIAIPVAYIQPQLPSIFWRVVDYLADLTLPLALLCIGASLSFSSFKQASSVIWLVIAIKLVMVPLIVLGIVFLGFQLEAIQATVLVVMFASPTAAASFVMVKAIGGDATLAANVVAMTTLFSMLTIPIFLLFLFYLGVLSPN